MVAQLIDGNTLAKQFKEKLKKEVESLKRKNGVTLHLRGITVGMSPAAELYSRQIKEICQELGIEYKVDSLPEETVQDSLTKHIEDLNQDPTITGVLLFTPLPEHLNEEKALEVISPDKDVEGIHETNLGKLVNGQPRLIPCTAAAVIELIKSTGIEIEGKEATIIGRSAIVGRPVSLLLLDLSATPTVCHRGTKDLQAHTKNADILVVAAGKPNLVEGHMIKPGAIVIDVGINRVPETGSNGKPILDKKGRLKMKTVGDVDFEKAKEVAAYLTPVPGGVGPMTVVMLISNLLRAHISKCHDWDPSRISRLSWVWESTSKIKGVKAAS